jgi:hypothetical protein
LPLKSSADLATMQLGGKNFIPSQILPTIYLYGNFTVLPDVTLNV